MDKNYFRILKELNSLKTKLPSLRDSIAEELGRIEKINQQRTQRLNQLQEDKGIQKELNEKLAIFENEIFQHSKTYDQAKAAKTSVFTEAEIKALTTQLEFTKNKIDELETNALEIIDKAEVIEEQISHANSFLEGSLETIKEIEAEINQCNEPIFKEIKTINSRIENLLEQLPEKVQKKLEYLENKGPNFTAISQITEKNTCESCGYLIPMALLTSIETHQKFHTCPGCERILIPQASKYL